MSANLTIDQLCQRWPGITRQKLSWWRHKKKGPAYLKVGREVLYPVAAIEVYEEQNLKEPGEAKAERA